MSSDSIPYELAIQQVKDYAIFMMDPDGGMISWNPGVREVLGWEEEEWLQARFKDIFPPDEPEGATLELARARKEGRTENDRWQLRKDGRHIFANGITTAIFEGGKLRGFLKVLRDKTVEKMREDASRAGEEKFRLIMASVADHAIFTVDLKGRVTNWNTGGERIFGYKAAEIVGKAAEVLFTAEDRAAGLPEKEREVCREEGSKSSEVWQVRKNGERFLASGSMEGLRNEAGELRGYVKIIRDITQEQETRSRLQLFGNIVESSTDFIGYATAEGRPVYINRAGLKLVGLDSLEEARRFHISDFFAPKEAEFSQRVIMPTVMREGRWEGEFPWRHFKTGELLELHYNVFSVKDSQSGELIGFGTVTRDLREQKRVEKELREIRERLEAALWAGDVATWVWQIPEDRVIADKNLARLFSVSDKDAQGGPLSAYVKAVHPEDRERVGAAISQALEGGQSTYEAEYRVVLPEGAIRWVIARGKIERDEQGRPLRMPGLVLDITQRKAVEAALASKTAENERQRRLYETILSSTPDLVYVFDLNKRFTYANRALLTMLGRSWEEAMGKKLLELGYEAWHAAMHERELEEVIATGKPVRGVVPFTGTHGRRIYDYIFVPVLGENGEVEAIAGSTRDITERQMGEEALRKSEERFRAFVTATSDVVYSMSADWSEMRYLEGMDFVSDTKDPTESWLEKYIPKEEQERVLREIGEAIGSKSMFQLEHRIIRVDGSIGWTLSRAIPLTNEAGEIVGWFGAARDITEQKRAEELLAEQAKHMEQLVQERTAALRETVAELEAFSYSVSHDMRSPLRAMHGFSEVLLEEKAEMLDEEGKELLRRIQGGAKRLDLLIQDILTYSRVANAELKLGPVNLGTICDDILRSYPELQKDRAEVIIEQPLHTVLGHEAFLAQIFSNLLSNAVKFVPAGRRPVVRIRSELVNRQTVRVWVEDNGIGIGKEHRDRIFSIFGRVHPDTQYPGTGIGLSIVKKAVSRMGGDLGYESQPGEGSKFWFTLKAG